MSPVPFRNVVFVSSEDDSNPASNLLEFSTGKKWLCSSANKSGKAEVVVMLSKKTRIASIEICNFGSAFVEVFVGNSESPNEFITLLPSSMMMSPADSKAGRSKTRTKVFPKERLSSAAVSKKWNLVKIKCVQMYNSDPFGLQYVGVFTESHEPQTPTAWTSNSSSHHLLSPSSHSLLTPSHSSLTPQTKHSGQRNLSLSSSAPRPTSKTPKRPGIKRRDSSSEDDFEFSGVEKQSRLFRNCVRGKTKENNPILERIRNKFKSESSTKTMSPSYERKTMLKKELPKAEMSVDFMAGYKSKKQDINVASACSRMADHDNDFEIGEEPEVKWGGKYRGKAGSGGKRQKRGPSGSSSPGSGGWLGKKKKLDIMINECREILDKADPTHSDKPEQTNNGRVDSPHIMDDDSDAEFGSPTPHSELTTHDTNIRSDGGVEQMIQCPICEQFFPSYFIDVHASTCGEEDPPVSIIPIVID